ncbi:hypothetical protein [Pedobacter endophyticus]|uniref:Uncharacterized protein n=1 Tax=Pedobacter endophyticus TaxID=2789740 RepID=A0A7U3Q560_9SPHI|nr:hypothetical protein [Pedobacter endophyticus]QPH38757.1 hypothetical protein IZT61_17035 [Pedobacter endophyticus]
MKNFYNTFGSLSFLLLFLFVGSCKKEPEKALNFLKSTYRPDKHILQNNIDKLMAVGVPPKFCYYYYPSIEYTIGYPAGTDPQLLDRIARSVEEELSKAASILYLSYQQALNAYQSAQNNAFQLVTGAGFNYYPPTVYEPYQLCPGDDGYMALIDPCFQKMLVGNMARDSIIAAQNSTILTKTTNTSVEYGAEVKLVAPTSFSPYKSTTVRTDNATNNFNPKFTWSTTDGFTVGVSHGHPSNSAPSPADAIWLVSNINVPALRNASTEERNFFRSNVFVTVVASLHTYVITVNNWQALEKLYFEFKADEAGFNANYIRLTTEHGSSEHALLSLFGEAINLYKAPAGSTNFKPVGMAYGGTGDFVIEILCP